MYVSRSNAISVTVFFLQRGFRLAKALFLTWVVFVLLWLPSITIMKIDEFRTISVAGYHAINASVLTNSGVNFIIYGSMNKTFRKAYISLLTCKKN